MRRVHLATPKKTFRLSKPLPVRNVPADVASAIAQLQQNQALIIDAINALNMNLGATLLFAVNAAESAANSDTIDSDAAISGELFTVLANWVQTPSDT